MPTLEEWQQGKPTKNFANHDRDADIRPRQLVAGVHCNQQCDYVKVSFSPVSMIAEEVGAWFARQGRCLHCEFF